MSKRGRNKGLFFDKQSKDIHLNQFYNEYTLNIFSDASFIPGYYGNPRTGKGCYTILAVCQDTIIEQVTVISSNSTVPESELKGVRKALSTANKYKSQFKYINIFTDSLYTVDSLKKRIYCPDPRTKNINLILETQYIYSQLEQSPDCLVTIYHQSGHIQSNSSFDKFKEAGQKFMRFNNYRGSIDTNFIRYISVYNNMVDNLSRTYLSMHRKEEIVEPVKFLIGR